MKRMGLYGIVAGLGWGLISGGSAQAANEWKTYGFVDAQYQWTNTTNTGFRLGDAAARLSYEGKEVQGRLAVPFTFSTTGTTTTLLLGTLATRGEAWVSQKYSNGFSWKAGQFDSVFGVERNYLDQNWAANFGLLRSAAYQPLTFMGVAVGYKIGNFEATLLGADARNTSIIGAAGAPDLGAQVGYVTDGMWAKAGFLYNSAAATGILVDAVLGAKMGGFKTDLGFQMATPAAVTTLGFLLQPVYAITDSIDVGARGELLLVSGTSTFQVTVGPGFTPTPGLKIRPQYTLTSAPAGTSHAVIVSALFSP